MGGNFCAVPGCHTSSAKCKGLSFFAMPKKKRDKEWRQKLLRRIGRKDNFNEVTAKICSRHFKPECFSYGELSRRTLFTDSMPTEYMPPNSEEVSPPTRRKPVAVAPLVSLLDIRERIYNFDDVRSDAESLPSTWCVIGNCQSAVTVALTTSDTISSTTTVTITPDLNTRVWVLNLPAPRLYANILAIKLYGYLADLENRKLCGGIVDKELLDFAKLPAGKGEAFYKHILYMGTAHGITHIAAVRSSRCDLLMEDNGKEYCDVCRTVRCVLQRRLERAKLTRIVVMNKNIPYNGIAVKKFKSGVFDITPT